MRVVAPLSVLLLACCGHAPPPPVRTTCAELEPEDVPGRRFATLLELRASGPLAELAWLAGEWHSFDPETGRCTVEQWMTPAGTSMLGGNRTVAGGRTVAHEQLRLEAREDGIVYVASPSGQQTTEFRLVDSGIDTHGASYAVFENPEHDFPVRVGYRLEGDAMTAWVEGREPGERSEWRFHTLLSSACPSSPGETAAPTERVDPGQEQAPMPPTCVGDPRPIDQQRWVPAENRVVLEATTCSYRVAWTGWSPPRTYDYRPDGACWIGDYFISGYHGQVFWNVVTGQVRVRPRHGQELPREGALALARHALDTIFPGIVLETLVFDPRPCPEDGPCTPH